MKQKEITILAIETSCDDTCVAVIKVSGKKNPNFNILSNIVSSQVKIHRKYGGVYPMLAKREHQKNLPLILKKALEKNNLPNRKKIDLITVTNGPGLDPCLWVGVNFAKNLSWRWNVPLIPINHIEAHILINLINKSDKSKITFPVICLVVSGGHTQLILMQNIGKYKILGETRDDAAGECFDKTAKILGLEYPGGPAIAANAAKFKTSNFKNQTKLPRPMIYTKDYDFSFSGLKTAVLYNFKSQSVKIRKNKQYIREMCHEIQQAIIDVLIKKTIKAAKDYKVKTIILGGGVSANNELRKQFIENWEATFRETRFESGKTENCKILISSKNFCTDNAVMVGVAGYFQWLKGKTKEWQKIKAEANLRIN